MTMQGDANRAREVVKSVVLPDAPPLRFDLAKDPPSPFDVAKEQQASLVSGYWTLASDQRTDARGSAKQQRASREIRLRGFHRGV
jgi:hypothetical protein